MAHSYATDTMSRDTGYFPCKKNRPLATDVVCVWVFVCVLPDFKVSHCLQYFHTISVDYTT